nr:hypothetical protein Iba_chr12aCG9170 [Ipomoea batatas]
MPAIPQFASLALVAKFSNYMVRALNVHWMKGRKQGKLSSDIALRERLWETNSPEHQEGCSMAGLLCRTGKTSHQIHVILVVPVLILYLIALLGSLWFSFVLWRVLLALSYCTLVYGVFALIIVAIGNIVAASSSLLSYLAVGLLYFFMALLASCIDDA